jgi:AcrR family transcriptional regulator
MTDVVLSEEQRDALVAMVVRGMARGEASPEQAALAEAGLILVKGPMMMPTPAGTAVVAEQLRLPDDAPERERIMATFHRFLPVNRQLRDLCTAWQVRPDGSVNDHSDENYDADIRDRLDDIDDAVAPLLKRFSEDIPSMVVYRPRLTEALEKLDDGDDAWLASPLIDSYHTVWMHLHQHLLLTIGMTRKEDEELEERLVAGVNG